MHAGRIHAAEAIDDAAGMDYPMPGSSSPELEQLQLPTEGSTTA